MFGGRTTIIPSEELCIGTLVSSSGSQSRVWAGWLGDGRSCQFCLYPHPHPEVLISPLRFLSAYAHLNDPELVTEVRLKGADRTPHSQVTIGRISQTLVFSPPLVISPLKYTP